MRMYLQKLKGVFFKMKKLLVVTLFCVMMCAMSITAQAADIASDAYNVGSLNSTYACTTAPSDGVNTAKSLAECGITHVDIEQSDGIKVDTEQKSAEGMTMPIAQESTETGIFIYVGGYTFHQEEGTSIWAPD